MKKLCKKLNHTLFDVATGPFVLMLIGIPLLIVILVILLIWASVVLIRKAYLKSQQDGKAETGVNNTGADADTGTGDADTGVNNTGTGVADTGVNTMVENEANTIAGTETVDNIDKNVATVNKITAANDNTNNENDVDNGNTGTGQDQ